MEELYGVSPDNGLSMWVADMGGRLIVQALGQIDTLEPASQADAGTTYAHKIDKSETRINWSEPAQTVKRKINAFSPFPGAWFEVAGERVKALRAGTTDAAGTPGEVLDGLTIACGDGAVQLLEVQRAGKKAGSAADFLRGNTIPSGTVLD